MNRVDWLRTQRTRPTAIWTEFTLAKTRRPDALFVFLEGKDDVPFYLPELRRRWSSGEVQPLVCDGKEGVLEALARFSRDASAIGRALFFCDKDLDDYLGGAPPQADVLFVTSVYSLENYLVTEELFCHAWTDLFRLPASDPRLESEVKLFGAGLGRFHRMIRPVMAWVLLHREAKLQLCLNQVNLDQLIAVSTNFVPTWRRRDIGVALRNMCTQAVFLGSACLHNAAKRFRGHEPKMYVRGKFELWFFVKCINRCLERLRCAEPGRRPSCKVAINESNAVAVLAGRGRLPRDLQVFLDRNIKIG